MFCYIEAGPGTERRYGGRTAQQRRDERRERLLDAGLELFGTIGYAGTTIEGVCARASLNARYFYEQFRNREELLGAVYERHVQRVIVAVQAGFDNAEPDRRLESGLRAFVDATLADERAARISYCEMVGVSPALEDVRRGVLRHCAGLVEAQAAELPRAREADRQMVAVALVAATDGLVIDWLSGARERPPSAIVDTLVTVFAPFLG